MTAKRSLRRADSIEPPLETANAREAERSHDSRQRKLALSQQKTQTRPLAPSIVDDNGHENGENLEDLTQPLALHSKRTGRRHKKLETRVS